MPSALDLLRSAYDSPRLLVARARAAGERVLRVVGSDAPWELLETTGLRVIRLAAAPGPTPRADSLLGSSAPWRIRSLLEQILEASPDPVLITRSDAEQGQVFATLRELGRLGEVSLGPVHLHDGLHQGTPASRSYNLQRLKELIAWLTAIGGDPISLYGGPLNIAERRNKRLIHLAALNRHRNGESITLSGADLLRIISVATLLPAVEYDSLLQQVVNDVPALPAKSGKRVFVTGSAHETAHLYDLLESCGAVIVGEDHDWGARWYLEANSGVLPLSAADPGYRPPATRRSLSADATWIARHLKESRAEAIVHFCLVGDESAPWLFHQVLALGQKHGLPVLQLQCEAAPAGAGAQDLKFKLSRFLAGTVAAPAETHPEPDPIRSEAVPAARSSRSQKAMRCIADFGRYQREWFESIRQRGLAGEPFAVVNANAPQEILRVLDIPFVVNQWWASIVAAKQQSGRYAALLETHHYPTCAEPYSAQGLAATFDDDSQAAPWGGLPKPDFLVAVNSSDATQRLFEAWAERIGARLFLFERTLDPRWGLSNTWWKDLVDHWDTGLESARLDLFTTELSGVIGKLEQVTGRQFDPVKLRDVMTLVNEQEDYYRRARDLIAASSPAPVGIVDTMPATMVPQWHRGTPWARDAAKAFYEEVVERVQRRETVVSDERLRLMWVGRGLWSNMGFYQRWEQSHGAVFVWSMYLALAADGYIRSLEGGRDSLRALAARFIPMGDELRMPTWAAAWHVKEARLHRIDGAVALTDADPFVLAALERAGVPVLRLGIDNLTNVDSAPDIDQRVRQFLNGLER